MLTRIQQVHTLIKSVGVRTAIRILCQRALGGSDLLNVSCGPHSLTLRPRDSDLFVIAQVFGAREYEVGAERRDALRALASAWRQDGKVPLIVDAGANAGYSSLFFADSFPEATVIAVEPDARSFALIQQNCAAIDRIIPVHAALWSHDHGVSLRNSDAASWARSVSGDDGLIPSLTLEQLVRNVPNARPLILKLDVEGAEREICKTAANLVREFPAILVEPHDFMMPGAGCLSPLFSAIAGKQMDTILSGENLMFFDCNLGAPVA